MRLASSEEDIQTARTLCREWLDWHWDNYPADWPKGDDHPMDPVGFQKILSDLPNLHKRPLGGILIASVDGNLVDVSCITKRVQESLREVVLVLRPLCGPVKVDQGFISGCNSHRLCFGRIGLVGGQDAMGRVRSFGIVIGQPSSDAAAGL